jgi:excisionase family DNA binding protein
MARAPHSSLLNNRPNMASHGIAALLAEVARELDGVDALPADLVAGWLCQVAALQNLLAARWLRDLQQAHETAHERDQLLTVDEAADRLACSKDWLYRHHHRLAFAVRNGRHLRFSAEGLDRYIRSGADQQKTSHFRGVD